MTDYKEYAKQMRENAVKNEYGNIVCHPELWEEIASIVERAIIPPCKVGDTVYQYGKKFTKCTAHDYAPQHEDDSECIGCCAECDSKTYDFLHEGVVSEIKITTDYLKVRVRWNDKWDNSAYEIGKTVFLTKEEAEAKLRKRSENNA